jgi:hypothetical protein
MKSRYKNKESYNENKMQVIHERILNLTKDPAPSRKRRKNWRQSQLSLLSTRYQLPARKGRNRIEIFRVFNGRGKTCRFNPNPSPKCCHQKKEQLVRAELPWSFP